MKKIFTIALLFVATSLFATTINVPSDFSTIQAALNAAGTGDTITVNPGTYNEHLTWPATQSIKLLSLGDSSNTIIDGSGTGRVLLFPSNSATDTTTIVRGFKLTNGFSLDNDAGAGLKLISSSPLIDQVAIVNNFGNGSRVYGAGVHIAGGTAVFRNSCINYNDGIPTGGNYFYGGGCHIESNANVLMENCEISYNSMDNTSRAYGCGVYVTSSTLTLNVCTLSFNHAVSSSWAYGAGAYATGNSTTLNMNNCISSNNTMEGANYNYGGSLYGGNGALLNITDSYLGNNFLLNSSRCYGGSINISSTDTKLNLIRSKLMDNDLNTTTWAYGGGLYVTTGSDAYLENSLIANNKLDGTGFSYSGGGIYMNGDSLEILHSTIADNYRASNQSIAGTGIHIDGTGYTNFRSSILYNDNSGAEIDNAATLVITYSDVRNGYTGTGNINALPDFVGSGDYHINSSSPCKEVADPNNFPNTDLDNGSRPIPVNTDPDMGAYEALGPIPTAAICCNDTICEGDSIQLNATISGGKAPYTYAWSPSVGLSNTTIEDPMASPSSTTTYQLIVTDDLGEKDTAYVTITVISGSFADAGTNASVCGTECANLSGSGTGDFSWTPSTGLSCTNCPTPVACPTGTTTYYLTTDTAGCMNTDSVTVTVNPLPTAEAGTDQLVCAGGCATLNATGGTSYDWSPSTGLSCTNCANPDACPGDTTTYYVTVTDGNGCTAIDSVTVNVDPCASIGENINNIVLETYPNPFDNQVVFNFGSTTSAIIEVMDQHGRIVLTKKVNSNTATIETGNLGAGIYHYKVATEKGNAVGKLVKL